MIYEPRAGDARALVVSLGLGALIGLAIGGAYIAGGVAREAVSRPLLAQADHVQIPAPPAAGAQTSADPTSADPAAPGLRGPIPAAPQPASLRDRFSVAFGLTRPAAAPFHFKGSEALSGDHARDTQCLAQAVYYEARGESPSGQAAVAQVVLNRVRHPAFPKTICGVVFQRLGPDCQFSFACNGAMRQPLDRESWRRATAVADRALNGAVMTQVGSATHFQAARSSSGWAGSLAEVAQIGEHIFYRFTGRAGAPRMFKAEPLRSGPGADPSADGDAGRVHTAFTVATAAPAPEAKLQTVDAKPSAAGPSAGASPPIAKTVEPVAKAPTVAGESPQPLKAAEPETSKPIAATATQS